MAFKPRTTWMHHKWENRLYKRKKECSWKVTETQRRVPCDEDLMRLSLLSRPEQKGNPRLQGWESQGQEYDLCDLWLLSLALIHSHTLCLQPGASRGMPLSWRGCGGACESRKTAPTPREQCKSHSARRTQRQLHSSTWSFCMGHLMVINMTITIWKRK